MLEGEEAWKAGGKPWGEVEVIDREKQRAEGGVTVGREGLSWGWKAEA